MRFRRSTRSAKAIDAQRETAELMEFPPGLIYERYAPSTPLADYIEHFWIIDADVGPRPRREILIPNGRPVVLVNLGDPGHRIDPGTGAAVLNDSAISGIATRPVIISQSGRSRLVAAQPSPFGLSALGAPLAVDATTPLADWQGGEPIRRLTADLLDCEFGEPAARRLERALLDRFTPLAPVTLERVKRMVALIEDRHGDMQVADLVRAFGAGYDAAYRDFRRHVGVPPKTFIAIVRYHTLVGRLLADRPGDGLAQLALMQGYYDQAHANRDFHRFTGVTPTRFRETLNGIARMMHTS